MVLLVALALLSSVGAQPCRCDSDRTKGWWSEASLCTTCDFSNTPLEITALPANGCSTFDRCRDITRPLRERTCYGVGQCINSDTTPCNCTGNLAGTYCEKCATGFTNWPGCITPVCSPTTCNGHGTCVAEAYTVACGVAPTPSCRSDNAAAVCSGLAYTPATEQCVQLDLGTASTFNSAALMGQTACGVGTCQFGSTCANPAYALCCMNDEVMCEPKDKSKRPICCHPTQTCCDGVCCDGSQTCTDIQRRGFVVEEQMVNTVWEFNTPSLVPRGDPRYSSAWGGGPWNEWTMMDGSTATPWKTCSSDYLGAVATTRVVILPLGLTVAAIISLLLVWQTVGMNPIMVAIPAILLIFFSIFLFYSVFWTFGIVITLAALFAMGAGHKGGNAFLVAIVVELFALAVVCGGLGLGQFFYASNLGGNLFFGLGTTPPSAHSYSWDALARCSAYYDYFFVDINNRAWDNDPNQNFTNYCSEGWYAYIGLVADFVVTLQIIMLVATGVAYLRGAGTGKSAA